MQPGLSPLEVASAATGCSTMAHAELIHHRPYRSPVQVLSPRNGTTEQGLGAQRARKGVTAGRLKGSMRGEMLPRNSGRIHPC